MGDADRGDPMPTGMGRGLLRQRVHGFGTRLSQWPPPSKPRIWLPASKKGIEMGCAAMLAGG
jgi:hypothetical protein